MRYFRTVIGASQKRTKCQGLDPFKRVSRRWPSPRAGEVDTGRDVGRCQPLAVLSRSWSQRASGLLAGARGMPVPVWFFFSRRFRMRFVVGADTQVILATLTPITMVSYGE